MPPEPDAEVLARFVQGEREAFETLFREFERDVYRWIVRIVREPGDAEDVLVEAFWRAYRARARFDPSAQASAARIRRIATNAALARLRSIGRHPPWSALDERAAARASDRDLQEAIAIAFRIAAARPAGGGAAGTHRATAAGGDRRRARRADRHGQVAVVPGTARVARRTAPAGNSAMTDDDLERLLRAAIPPVDATGPGSDLWPAVARRVTRLLRGRRSIWA